MPYSERFTFPVGARIVFDQVVVFRRLCLSKSKSMLKSKACNKRPLSGCLGVDGGAGSTVTVTEQGYIRRGRGWLKPMGGSHVIVELRPCLFPMRCSQRSATTTTSWASMEAENRRCQRLRHQAHFGRGHISAFKVYTCTGLALGSVDSRTVSFFPHGAS